MTSTIGTQRRTAAVNGLTATYSVETIITDRGDLPSAALFVLQILDEDDPKQDELLRVATVADLIDVESDRPTALARSMSIYRTAAVTKTYVDVNAATAAYKYLQENLDAVVVEYQTYLTDFLADPGQTFILPQADVGVLAPAIAVYVAKVEQRQEQETLIAASAVACAQLDTDLAVLQTREEELLRGVTALQIASTALSDASTALQSVHTVQRSTAAIVGNLLPQYVATRLDLDPAEQGELDVYLLSPGGQLNNDYRLKQIPSVAGAAVSISALTAQLVDVNTRLAQLRADVTTAQADLSAKESAQTECARSHVVEQSVLDTLLQQETALLDTVQALCPDYSGT